MKKIFALSLMLILGACAAERKTTFYSTQGQVGKPETFILTNEDYEKQQEEKKKQKLHSPKDPWVKPTGHDLISLDQGFEQKDLAKLYEAIDAEVVSVGPPEGVSESIGQERLQKTLGRLTCVKQRPLTSALGMDIHYYCSVDSTRSRVLAMSDKILYENLSLVEEELKSDTDVMVHDREFNKTAGRFYCKKRISMPAGDVKYRCGVHEIIGVIGDQPLISTSIEDDSIDTDPAATTPPAKIID